jgi:hypothetical protein
MTVRSALRACHPLPPGRFLVLVSLRGCVDPRAIVRLEGLGQLKKFTAGNGYVEMYEYTFIYKPKCGYGVLVENSQAFTV